MATLTLKNVPVELVDRLKEEAKENRRSLNQEALSASKARSRVGDAPRRRSSPTSAACTSGSVPDRS